MSRTARLTDALSGRGMALALLAAAVSAVGAAGGASAAAAPVAQPSTISRAAATSPFGVSSAAAKTTGHVGDRVTDAPQSGLFAQVAKHATAHAGDTSTAAAARPATHQARTEPARLAHHVEHWRTRSWHPAPARHHGPYLIYDSITPSAIPAHHEVATYATGNFAVPASQVTRPGRVLWIDTNGSDPRAAALDVEPGDATPSLAANWVWRKLRDAAHSVAIIYTMRSEWPAVQAAVDKLPWHMRTHVRWWIADPTGVPHIVPGSSATQWYWGQRYDITTAKPGFQ